MKNFEHAYGEMICFCELTVSTPAIVELIVVMKPPTCMFSFRIDKDVLAHMNKIPTLFFDLVWWL